MPTRNKIATTSVGLTMLTAVVYIGLLSWRAPTDLITAAEVALSSFFCISIVSGIDQ